MDMEEEDGASLIEYALLIALIAILCISGVTLLGEKTSVSYSVVAASLN